MHESLTFWIVFNGFVALMLALDLGVFHRKDHAMSFREAIAWTSFWMALAAGFAILVFFLEGRRSAIDFVTGYVIEQSLSVDNLFVFLTLFGYFHVPKRYQYKVLFWGILGALLMRGLFIFVGVGLVDRFEWIMLLFGAFLLFTAVRMLFRDREKQGSPEANPLVRFARKHMRVTEDFGNGQFFLRKDGLRYATPLFLVLLLIEASDLLFAVDSIPAVLSITTDAFIVYTSNVFAILGLRALYFALAGVMERFRFVDQGVATILAFVGAKMVSSRWLQIS
ncbi:MAG: TerC family protein, partial [Acidobacteriaceae bacterium]